MADTMQFDLVSPERQLASIAATEVELPGAEGDMVIMPDHEMLVTTLKPGIVRVRGAEGEAAFVVTGGFAEVSAESASVLAEEAIPVEEVTQDVIARMMQEAVEARENATPQQLDQLAMQATAIAAMAAELGLSVNQG